MSFLFARTGSYALLFGLAAGALAVALAISSVVVCAFLHGNITLILGRVRELSRDDPEARTGWTFATLAYAIGQAEAAYAIAFLFARTGSYALLFGLAAGAIAAALAIDFLAARLREPSYRP